MWWVGVDVLVQESDGGGTSHRRVWTFKVSNAVPPKSWSWLLSGVMGIPQELFHS